MKGEPELVIEDLGSTAVEVPATPLGELKLRTWVYLEEAWWLVTDDSHPDSTYYRTLVSENGVLWDADRQRAIPDQNIRCYSKLILSQMPIPREDDD